MIVTYSEKIEVLKRIYRLDRPSWIHVATRARFTYDALGTERVTYMGTWIGETKLQG